MSGMERLQRMFGGAPPDSSALHPILPPSIPLTTSTSPPSKSSNTIHWSVFDSVKKIPVSPEALMTEINTGITNLEYARATALLETPCFSHLNSNSTESVTPGTISSQYDVRMADEAYRAGCAALAAGKLDEALHSLNISLSKCPPDKTSAVAKLQSLISLTSQQLQRSSN